MNNAQIDLSISITSYKTKEILSQTIDSIFHNTKDISFEIIVVDNGSEDGTVEYLKKKYNNRIRLFVNAENQYLTKAQNQALKIANGRYFIICNSDIYVPQNTIKEMVRFLDQQSDAGSLSCIDYGDRDNPDISFDIPWDFRKLKEIIHMNSYLAHKFLSSKKSYYKQYDPKISVQTIPINSDAFMMCRTQLLRAIGGYDEKFKLYYTEDDLSRRIFHAGYKNYFLTYVHYYHISGGSQSTRKVSRILIRKVHSEDALIYIRKYFKKYQFLLAKMIFTFDLYLLYLPYLFLKKNFRGNL